MLQEQAENGPVSDRGAWVAVWRMARARSILAALSLALAGLLACQGRPVADGAGAGAERGAVPVAHEHAA